MNGDGIILTTMNDLPGHEIEEVYGTVFGLTVRSRHVGSQIGAGLKSLMGGELKGMTKLLAEGRGDAEQRLDRGGEGGRRERGHRVPLRQLRARLDVDGDLRLRDGCARAPDLIAVSDRRRGGRAR